MAVTGREVFKIILLLLLAFYNPMLATTWAHGNSNLLLNAIQDASPVDRGYLKAKVRVNGFELNADYL